MRITMKSVMLLIIALLAWNGRLSAQAPVKVKETLFKMFPKAQEVEWEEDDDVFIASFVLDKKAVEATFESSGKWTETKTEWELSKLSALIKDAILKKFKGCTLDEAVFVETEKSKYYVVGISTEDENYLFVTVNEKGKILEYN